MPRGYCPPDTGGMTQAEIEWFEWGDYQGDYWHRSWTLVEGGEGQTLADLVIEIRNGEGSTAALVASSVVSRQGATVAAINTAGSQLGGPGAIIIDWEVEGPESAKVPAGQYIIQIEALVDGKPDTLQTHSWRVDPETAVRP